MELETEHIQYGVELSLSVLGASATYFINFSNPVTLLTLLFVPVLYGYTVFISQEEFTYASLASLAALAFVVVGGITSIIALFYGLGNVLVSYFSSGSRFKDFYGATSLPVLVIGALIGVTLFTYGTVNPSFQNELAEIAGDKSGQISGQVIPMTEIVQNQKKTQIRMINSTADLTIRLTAQQVINKTSNYSLRQVFRQSRDEIKKKVYHRFNQEFKEKNFDISSRVDRSITTQLKQINFVIVIPLATGLFYSIQPLLGILTGLFGKFFSLLGR